MPGDTYPYVLRYCQGDFRSADGSDQIANRIVGLEFFVIETLADIRAADPNDKPNDWDCSDQYVHPDTEGYHQEAVLLKQALGIP